MLVYRFPNLVGKWIKPNYNSAAATFCYNIAHNLPIQIRDRDYIVHYNYVDDIVDSFIDILSKKEHKGSKDILIVSPIHDCSLGKLADLLYYFKGEVESIRHLPLIHGEFELKLFKTFMNYLSDDGYSFNYAEDNRGSFEELYKSKKYGQISDNMSFPGITKGGHYHTFKEEVFLTVVGECEVKQRNIKTNEMLANRVKGDKPELVNIHPYYSHQITNIGKTNSHTIMWINEIYNPERHDTYKEDVEK